MFIIPKPLTYQKFKLNDRGQITVQNKCLTISKDKSLILGQCLVKCLKNECNNKIQINDQYFSYKNGNLISNHLCAYLDSGTVKFDNCYAMSMVSKQTVFGSVSINLPKFILNSLRESQKWGYMLTFS